MKKILLIVAILLILLSATFLLPKKNKISLNPTQSIQNNNQATNSDIPKISIVAQNLDTPWGLVFLPDKSILLTERAGTVRLIDENGNLESSPVATIKNSKEIGEGGLLGIALHPDFSSNHFIYLYYTYNSDGNNTLNRVVRMRYENKTLFDEKIIVDKIPGAPNHNGGRIKFGPDKFLYIATGDAQNPSLAQNANSSAGKILRVTDEGKSANDNPFNNIVYSYGHRNPQGLAWDSNGNLWATEHGRSGVLSGLDELNLVEKGKNYGWPDVQGDQAKNGMQSPILNSGESKTWAPAGMAFLNSSLFFGGLRGQTLYKATIENKKIASFNEYFVNEFGRIRDVTLGPDNMLYITTSNKDGRGIPQNNDDKIIKVNPDKL